MKIVVAFTKDEDVPSGGARQLYRHVDILNQLGFDAMVAHPTRGFKYSWFKNDTRAMCSEDVALGPDDFLVFGEQVEDIPKIRGADRCAKVVIVQNPWGMFLGFRKDLSAIKGIYSSAAGVLCQSKYTEENVKFFFPAANVLSYRYSFDKPPFSYCGDKRKIVAFMPRKNTANSQAVFSLIRIRRCPDDWQIASLDGASEERVAEVMRLSAVFVSFSINEGFGIPPCEAMACGCTVVGFTGFAGDEYMRPGLCFPVRDYDVLGLTKELDKVLTTDFTELVKIGKRASDFVRLEYSTEKEVAGIKAAWEGLAKSSVEVSSDVWGRVRKEVAAYVPVYNEGPYLEHLLRWLIGKVGAVFVCESEKSWCPTAEPGGRSKAVVDKVLAEVPEAKDVLKYILVSESGAVETEPLKREAEQRNRVLGQIMKIGFKYVWMVEADEFYTNEDAERLWKWLFSRDRIKVARCHWHTYWRSMRWRIEPPELFAPNIVFRTDCRFERGRKMSEADESGAAEVPIGVCVVRHYSWARTPSDTRRKLSAWGHARELKERWFENVFMAWKPGCGMKDLHPIVPEQYRGVVRCGMPVPEALAGHPFTDVELIEDGPVKEAKTDGGTTRMRIKAVVMSHNQPESVDRLYEALEPVFDNVEVFDSGSDPDKVPIHTTRSFPNIYWTGLWNEVIKTCSDCDAVWVLGGDVELRDDPANYRRSIERSLPFGCWSPAVDGRSKLFMKPACYDGASRKVVNIEGIAMAASGSLLKSIGELPKGNQFGFGQDLWMCWKAREERMHNIVDGGVVVRHPGGTGYDAVEAGKQMDETFGGILGKGYRRDKFRFSDIPEENFEDWPIREKGMEKKFTVVTVDNGWGLSEFLRIVGKVEGVRALVMRKGVLSSVGCQGAETIPYELSLGELLKEADAALFTKVGEANKEEYLKLLKAGVPMVVHDQFHQGMIEHQKNGFLYIEDMWATRWLALLRDDPEERRKVSAVWVTDQKAVSNQEDREQVKKPRVTVITPTYRRDPAVVRRCIGCMLLQTFQDWEQVVCSDGGGELAISEVVKEVGDSRVRYSFTATKKDGDFGNTVRKTVLEVGAKGEYVLFFDDDNLILPHYLERMVAALEAAPDAGFAVCRVMHFGPLHESEGKPPKVLTGERVALYHIDPLQVLARTKVMRRVGWDTEVGYLSDGVTLENLGKQAEHVRVDEVLGIHM